MIIPGFIISWLTFPGVIVHELAHQLFCYFTKTKVVKVCYFRFGNPAGYVLHETPTSTWRHILIGIGPFFLNTVVGVVIGLSARPMAGVMGQPVVGSVLFWLAISIAMHAFPSTGDAKSIWNALWERESPLLAKCVGTPLVGLIFVGAFGSIVWLDALYGFGVVVWFPEYLRSL